MWACTSTTPAWPWCPWPRPSGILKSMGAAGRGTMGIFVTQGVVIGAVGTLLGAGLGGLICYLQAAHQIIQLKGDVYFLSVLPIQVKPWDVAWVVAGALRLSFLP